MVQYFYMGTLFFTAQFYIITFVWLEQKLYTDSCIKYNIYFKYQSLTEKNGYNVWSKQCYNT